MVLGVTGGIASGKSTVVALLQRRGARVISADELSRELVEPGTPALRALVAHFGSQILHSDGTLNRQLLGEVVFADAEQRKALEAILHPAIGELSQQRLQQAVDAVGPGGLVVYEAPLLFEVGAESRVDKVLTVTVDPAVQLRRLMVRDGSDASAAGRRIAAQMSQAEKVDRADYVIDNSGTLESLEQQVDQLLRRLAAAD